MAKLLYMINYLTNGGPTRVLQNIIKNVDHQKYHIIVMTFVDKNEKNIVEQFKKDGIEVIEFKYKKSLDPILMGKKQIIDRICNINPDIIHVHGIVPTFLGASKKIKSFKVTTIHNNIYEDYGYTYGKIIGKLYALMHIKCLKKYHENICCSKTSFNVLEGKVPNLSYIRNGIDISEVKASKTQIRKELNIPKDAIVYVYGGVITNRKRVVELAKLFHENIKTNEYLLIVGDGPLKEQAQIYENSQIKFLGFKTNIIDYFNAADIYVSNSSSEGFSISVIEALATGLVCLLSDIPSHKECFEIDDNYYIGEYFNEHNFKTKKDKVFKKINGTNDKIVKSFQKKYLSSYAMANQYERIYEKWNK